MIRRVVASLLILCMAPLLVSLQVGGQAYVTQTTTTLVTNSQAFTITKESIVETSSSHAQSIFSSLLTLPPTHGVCGTYFVQSFNGTLGSELFGNLTSTSRVDFYVMTDAAFQDWNRRIMLGGICTPSSVLLIKKGITSYNFTLSISRGGLYQIVVNNLSSSSVNAHLAANLLTSAPVNTTMTSYSASTQLNVQTLTLITLEQTASPTGDSSTLIFSGVLIIIVLIVAIAIARSRKVREKTRSMDRQGKDEVYNLSGETWLVLSPTTMRK